jgi:hypothetical protein
MNKAPNIEELLKVAQKENPSWYPFIHGYLNGDLPNMELDDSDADLGEQRLYMGNYDTCVVAEPFGFSSIYGHNDVRECFLCWKFANKLASFSDEYSGELNRTNFAITLESFYKHMGFMK